MAGERSKQGLWCLIKVEPDLKKTNKKKNTGMEAFM